MKFSNRILFISALFFVLNWELSGQKGPIAIIGAMPEEVQAMLAEMPRKREKAIEGIRFYKGKMSGQKVVLVEAGIGKVNAAMSTTLLLLKFHPKAVLFTGVAGGLDESLQRGIISRADRTCQHDYGRWLEEGYVPRPTRNPQNRQDNPAYFPADPTLLSLAQQTAPALTLTTVPGTQHQPQITTGTVATGDLFVASPEKAAQIRAHWQANAVEMEGAAVAQICHQQGVPHLIIRSISDRADHQARVSFDQFKIAAAQNAAALAPALVKAIARQKPAAKRP